MAAPSSISPQSVPPQLTPNQEGVILDILELELTQCDVKECKSFKEYHKRRKEEEFKRRKMAAEAKAQNKQRLYWCGLRNAGQISRFDSKRVRDALDKEFGDPTPQLPQCYEEIKKLLRIEKSPVCKKALEEWSRKLALLDSRVQRAKAEATNLKTEIYQLIGFYIAFPAFLYQGVAGSNLLHCNNWWSPALLSVLASIVCIAGIFLKTKQIDKIEEFRRTEERSLKVVEARLHTLRSKGPEEFEFAKFHEFGTRDESTGSQSELLAKYAAVGCLLIIAVVFPVSFREILCNPGANPYSGK